MTFLRRDSIVKSYRIGERKTDMRKITVRRGAETKEYFADYNETVMDVLRREGMAVNAPCGGSGKCGKCRVQVTNWHGEYQWVLACRTVVDREMEILLPEEETGGAICDDAGEVAVFSGGTGYGAAVDIGTTTVVLRLYDLQTGTGLGSRRAWNAQRPYGADVISRMQYIMEHADGLKLLTGLIRRQVLGMLEELCAEAEIAREEIHTLFVAGNTVMEHILAGIDPRAIAVAPYEPEEHFTDGKPRSVPEWPGLEVYYAPCVAGYVGGDITAGLLSSRVEALPGKNLFLDVGTNGEMALNTGEEILTCSVACGPAFEGAEISCGMGSVPGAVRQVDWVGGKLELDVIGGGKPLGICGSGILDLLAMLLRFGVVDESGRLLPPEEVPEEMAAYMDEDEDGNGRFYLTEDNTVYLTAGDVRKIQLAKGAVAAGISILLQRAGVRPETVRGLHIAGGFGTAMRPKSAAAIGMIPRELENHLSSVGNSSLWGAAAALCDAGWRKSLYEIPKKCRYIELAGDPAFAEAFMECMMFEEE